MNAIRIVARTDETVTLKTTDFEALLRAVEEAEDIAALLAAGAKEDVSGKAEARADHPAVDLVDRLIEGEHPVAVWRAQRGPSRDDLAATEAGRRPPSVADYRALGTTLGIAVDDLIAISGGRGPRRRGSPAGLDFGRGAGENL